LTVDNDADDARASKYLDDIQVLGAVFQDVLETHRPGTLNVVNRLREPALAWRDPAVEPEEKDKAFKNLCKDVSQLSPEALCDVTRSCSQFLALANIAESRDTTRARRELYSSDHETSGEFAKDALPSKVDSCAGTVDVILKDGVSPAKIFQVLTQQKVEIVFTAHPTEVNRKEHLSKHRKISELLAKRERMTHGTATTFEQIQNERSIRRAVLALWGSDMLMRSKPTPQQEAREGLAVVQTSLWDAVPGFMRRLDSVIGLKCQQRLPLDATPVVFASWMGGDRDGNPNVTSKVTHEVVAAQRRKAALMYLNDLNTLRVELSIGACTPAVSALPGAAGAKEPYRAVVDNLISRLRATVAWADAELQKREAADSQPLASMIDMMPTRSTAEALFRVEDLATPLHVMHWSLVNCGYEELADGALVDTIRRVGAFGMQLAPLDLRQESTRHARAVDALCKLAGVHGYLSWKEEDKLEWLSKELNAGRPLLRRGVFERLAELGVQPDELEVIQTAALVAELPPGSLGAYVISQATAASDVLAVELLMAEAGANPPLRVAPLFETLDDLNNAPDTLRQLLTQPGYAERTGRKQEVMVGYSDSAKDAGRIAAMWAQYESQEKMLEVARECGFEITFFHGKGGTVGRGGNPEVYKAILAHPQGTMDGRFRVTEQGEMIEKNFGDVETSERSMDIFTAALLRDQFLQRPAPTPEWRKAMDAMSEVSCDFYRSVVRGEPKFVPYFRTATPELELGALNVGSRPAKRNPKGGVESLRAIPWIFAWAQTRLNLPAWLGIGKAFEGALESGHGPVDRETLQMMYKDWPWFHTTVDLIEMLMAKSDRTIAAHYDERLVADKELLELGALLRKRFEVTEKSVMVISGHKTPAEDYSRLQRSLKARVHYIDLLNVIQVEALARLRAAEASGVNSGVDYITLKDTLLQTINGVATGMRNSG
jgi:phosphoenolpyruvate carboxylase